MPLSWLSPSRSHFSLQRCHSGFLPSTPLFLPVILLYNLELFPDLVLCLDLVLCPDLQLHTTVTPHLHNLWGLQILSKEALTNSETRRGAEKSFSFIFLAFLPFSSELDIIQETRPWKLACKTQIAKFCYVKESVCESFSKDMVLLTHFNI